MVVKNNGKRFVFILLVVTLIALMMGNVCAEDVNGTNVDTITPTKSINVDVNYEYANDNNNVIPDFYIYSGEDKIEYNKELVSSNRFVLTFKDNSSNGYNITALTAGYISQSQIISDSITFNLKANDAYKLGRDVTADADRLLDFKTILVVTTAGVTKLNGKSTEDALEAILNYGTKIKYSNVLMLRDTAVNPIDFAFIVKRGNELKAVIFSPVHLSMVKDGPIERRKFIDNSLCQLKSNYRSVLKEYNRCLAQRNMLLKDMKNNANLEDMLYIWDKNLAKSGAKIIYQREKYIEALLPFATEIFDGLSKGREKIDLKLQCGFECKDKSVAEIENELTKLLISGRNSDILNRITTSGPHRDDMEILINEKSARLYASQGQQRSCVLALKLAEASLLKEMTDDEPLALLDDVMSELDESRQDYITCCDANTVLRLKKGKTFHIENGRCKN